MMFKNTKIRTLLAVALLLLAVMLLIVGLGGLYGLRTTNEALASSSENVPTVVDVMTQRDRLARARLQLDRLVAEHDEQVFPSTIQTAKAYVDDSNRAWADYLAYPAGDVEKGLAADVARTREELQHAGIDPLISALQTSDMAAAHALAFVTIPRLYIPFSSATDRLTQFEANDSSNLTRQGRATLLASRLVTLASTSVAVLCALGSWIILNGAIARPLLQAGQHFSAIEGGDLTGEIVVERENELGRLLRSLSSMQASLRNTVTSMRLTIDRVADGAIEIATGSNDLSKRTEQQAASLEETAASMEQLTATVKQNADNTREASGLADSVSNMAQRGADSVARKRPRPGATAGDAG